MEWEDKGGLDGGKERYFLWIEPSPSSVVWNAWVPLKVSFFCLGLGRHHGQSVGFKTKYKGGSGLKPK